MLSRHLPQPEAGVLCRDREFIGNRWIAWLQQKGIPHVVRLREGMKVFDAAHAPASVTQHAARLKSGETLALAGDWRIGPSEAEASPPVRIVIMRLETGELLALASRTSPKRALALYRKRW